MVRLNTRGASLRKRPGSVALLSLLLALVMIAWITTSTPAAALFVGTGGFIAVPGTPEGLDFLAVLFGVGAVFAVLMFALAAWSLPMPSWGL